MSDIIKRFADIMDANIQDVLDKMENPEKQTKKILKDLERNLDTVKDQTAAVMAKEKQLNRELEAVRAEISEMEELAEKAVRANDDDSAEKFLNKKHSLKLKEESLVEAYSYISTNVKQMREMHDKLVSDIEICRTKQPVISAKTSFTKTKNIVSKNGIVSGRLMGAIGKFAKMEAKADAMLDEAVAREELDAASADPVEVARAKYKNASPSVSEELAALKAKVATPV